MILPPPHGIDFHADRKCAASVFGKRVYSDAESTLTPCTQETVIHIYDLNFLIF